MEIKAEIIYLSADGAEHLFRTGPQHVENDRIQIPELGVSMAFRITESEEGTELRIRTSTLCEPADGSCRIMRIILQPGLIGGQEGDGGALVLPYGCGAVLHHQGKPDRERMLPVFFPVGSACNCSGFGVWYPGKFTGAIVDGARCDFQLRIRMGKENGYAADPVFFIRDVPGEKPLDEDISILYCAPSSGWTDFAAQYRKYFMKRENIPSLEEKIRNNPAVEFSSRALSLRFRLGVKPMPCKIREQTPENQPPVKVFMSFADVREVADACCRAGVGPAEFNLVGWNYGAHDGAFPQLFPVEEALGGESELRKTIDYCRNLGYPASLHDNYFDSYTLAGNYRADFRNINPDGTPSLGGVYGGGQAYQVCPECAVKYAESNFPKVLKLNPEGSYYIDVLSVAQLTKCYDPAHPLSRRGNAKAWKQIMKMAQDTFGATYSEGARDWCLPELDRAYSISGTPALPDWMDEEIPLFPAIWHGVLYYNTYRSAINLEPSENLYLRNLAFGGLPIMYYHQIFNPEWTSADGWDKDLKFGPRELLDRQAAMFRKMTDDIARLQPIRTAFIKDFRMISEKLSMTEYSNGRRCLVNYGEAPAEVDGISIQPREFVLA